MRLSLIHAAGWRSLLRRSRRWPVVEHGACHDAAHYATSRAQAAIRSRRTLALAGAQRDLAGAMGLPPADLEVALRESFGPEELRSLGREFFVRHDVAQALQELAREVAAEPMKLSRNRLVERHALQRSASWQDPG